MNKKLLICGLVLLTGLSMSGCGGDSGMSTYSQEDMALNYEAASIDVQDGLQLRINHKILGNIVSWSSNNPSVASVTSTGYVNALTVGTSVISAKYKDLIAKCNITVVAPTAAPIIETNFNEVDLSLGGTVIIEAQTKYKGNVISQINYDWESEDSSIVSIENRNNKCLLIGKKGGTTQINVTTTYKNQLAIKAIFVTVREGVVSFDVSSNDTEVTPVEGGFSIQVLKGQQFHYEVSVYVDGVKVDNPFIAWSNTNEGVIETTLTGYKAAKVGRATFVGNYKNKGTVTIYIVSVRA